MITIYTHQLATSHCAMQSEYHSNADIETSMNAVHVSAADSVIGGLVSVVKVRISWSIAVRTSLLPL